MKVTCCNLLLYFPLAVILSALLMLSLFTTEDIVLGIPNRYYTPLANHPPVVKVGPNQTVNENGTVMLVGFAFDPDSNDKLIYSWRQLAGPAVKLNGTDTTNPSFTAPRVSSDTALKFSLSARDDKGLASNPAIVTITVKHANHPPVAIAEQNQIINPGNVVSLDGSVSKDPDGDPLIYSWTQTAGPTVKLDGANTPIATFTAPSNISANTTLGFKLKVTDDKNAVNISTVKVTDKYKPPSNQSPIANAGTDQTVNAGQMTKYALNGKGSDLDDLGNYTQAIQYYDKALAIDPKYKYALNNKGVALKNLGRYTEAIQYYDKALAIDPKYVSALYNKGSALDDLGNYTQAIQYYDKVLAIDPKDVETLNGKGLALDELGNHTEAIQYYDKALAIDPKYKYALTNRQSALSKLGH